MNILFLTYQGDIAGSTNSIAYLARGLAARGHNVYVGCRRESLLYAMLSGSQAHLVPMTFKSKFDGGSIRQITEAVQRHNIQVINAQSSKDRYTSILAKLKYGLHVKVVHTRRQVSKSSGGILQSLFYMAGTDKIIAVSEGVKKSLQKKGIRASHIEVIHNGTPRDKYQRLDRLKQQFIYYKLGLTEGDFVIGCVARKKNQEQLLEAMAKLPKNVKVIFVGMNRTNDYDAIIEKYQLQNRVVFEGMVPTETMLNYYPLFDVKVLPSTMEGLSQSLLEAMYLKIPVIATRAAGNIDLIKDGENGLFFEDENVPSLVDAINKVYRQTINIDELVANAFITASSDYAIERTINKYESFFNSLLENETSLVPSTI